LARHHLTVIPGVINVDGFLLRVLATQHDQSARQCAFYFPLRIATAALRMKKAPAPLELVLNGLRP
jgi:hypothetical protein